MLIDEAVRNYLERELVLQGRADSTRRCYLGDLRQFIWYIQENTGGVPAPGEFEGGG